MDIRNIPTEKLVKVRNDLLKMKEKDDAISKKYSIWHHSTSIDSDLASINKELARRGTEEVKQNLQKMEELVKMAKIASILTKDEE